MPRCGAQPGAGRKPGQKVIRPRTRRTPAQFAADKAAAELKAKVTTTERMSALEFLSCVVANEEMPGCEQSPPYKFDTQLMAAKTLIAYQSPRLNAITIDTREDDRRIEEIQRLHKAALEYKKPAGRRLAEHDKKCDELMDDIRKALAMRHLDGDEVKLQEFTFLLGFSSHAAFSALFKKWTGRTPRETRTLSCCRHCGATEGSLLRNHVSTPHKYPHDGKSRISHSHGLHDWKHGRLLLLVCISHVQVALTACIPSGCNTPSPLNNGHALIGARRISGTH